jgi:hypothetical protein
LMVSTLQRAHASDGCKHVRFSGSMFRRGQHPQGVQLYQAGRDQG